MTMSCCSADDLAKKGHDPGYLSKLFVLFVFLIVLHYVRVFD